MSERTNGRQMLNNLETRVSALERGEVAEDPREDIKQIRKTLKSMRDDLKAMKGQITTLATRLDDAGIA